MLFHETIDQPTLDLLKALQGSSEFGGMRLVGGTSLALQIGHRKSIDIDLFGKLEADPLEVMHALQTCGTVTTLNKSENIGVYTVNGIKVDIVNYPYPWLEEVLLADGLKLAGKKDIAAMKLAAVTNRGTKKDFIDVSFLLKQFSLTAMLDFYRQKYRDGAEFLVLKSLTFFDDAEDEPLPAMLQAFNWEDVKNTVIQAVDDYIQNTDHR